MCTTQYGRSDRRRPAASDEVKCHRVRRQGANNGRMCPARGRRYCSSQLIDENIDELTLMVAKENGKCQRSGDVLKREVTELACGIQR